MCLWKQKPNHLSSKLQQLLSSCRFALPLQLRWRPLAAAEAGATASGAAGMPVRWPRRPAAVSEAVAAGAGPDFRCAAGQKRATKPLIGEARSLSVVCVCVSGSVGRLWSCGRSSPVLVVWGGSPASGRLVISISLGKETSLSALLSCQAANLGSCSFACWHDSFVESRFTSRVPVSSSISPCLARGVESPVARRGFSLLSRACRLGSRCAVRFFRWTGEWGVLVG